MRSVKRAVVYMARPIYKAFFEEPLWWFLAKVKAFFFAEITAQVEALDRRLQAQEQRWSEIEKSNAAQWDAIEQLLLALFRQPELRIPESDWKLSASENAAISLDTELNRAHAAGNIR
jgi:ABC-type uncharacterized transport system ATPase subunit